MAQQELYGLRADSFDIFQFTVNETFASLLPVEGDAEAMGFVADVTHHFERFTRTAQVVGIGSPGKKISSIRLARPTMGTCFSIPSSHSTA